MLAQLGRPNAAAIDNGITFQAVLENNTAPLFRFEFDGSAIRKIPTESAASCNWNGALVPWAVFTSTVAVPDVPSSEGSTMLICPPVPTTKYSGTAVPFTSTERPLNSVAGKMLEVVLSVPKFSPNRLTNEFAAAGFAPALKVAPLTIALITGTGGATTKVCVLLV